MSNIFALGLFPCGESLGVVYGGLWNNCAGNDNLPDNAVYLDWTLTRQVEEQGSVTRYRSVFTNADILTAAGSDDLLFGGAGDGGDEIPLHRRSNSNKFVWRMAA